MNGREVVIVRRKGDQKVAMISADELWGLLETTHLLRSPRNAERLLSALKRAKQGKSKAASLDKLRQEMQKRDKYAAIFDFQLRKTCVLG